MPKHVSLRELLGVVLAAGATSGLAMNIFDGVGSSPKATESKPKVIDSVISSENVVDRARLPIVDLYGSNSCWGVLVSYDFSNCQGQGYFREDSHYYPRGRSDNSGEDIVEL